MSDRSLYRKTLSLVCWLVLAIAFLQGSSAWAQTATVRGFIKDASDGQPLQGVNVVLTDGGDRFFGNATNKDGLYAISQIPAGRYTLRISFVGYVTHVDTLQLAAGQVVTYSFDLKEDAAELEEVLVESKRETAGAAAVMAGLQTVRAKDIELIPSPDVSGDLVTYLTTMPGVVASGDQGGQLFIRGGEPTQNLVLIDGMMLYQPFHLIGFYSAFPSDIINSSDVYAGGFGARYGGRLSSVIDVSTRTGNKRRLEGSLSAAPFVSGLFLEGPLYPNRVSFMLSGRTSVIEQGASKLIDTPLPYKFDDTFAKIHADISETSQASISGIRTYDRGILGVDKALGEENNEANQVIWRNEALGGRYLLLPTNIPVLAEILLSYTGVENSFGPSGSPVRTSITKQYSVATNMTHYFGQSDVKWGIYLRNIALDSDLGGYFQNIKTSQENVTEVGAYLEPEFKLDVGTGLRIQPGIRAQSFPSKGQSFFEPRLRVVLDYGIQRFSGALGLYHQQIVGLNDRRDAGDVFTAWTSSPSLKVPESMHAILGYQVRPLDGVEFAVEGFYKKMKNLSVAEWTAFPRFTTRLQPADGDARGIDLRLELSHSIFYGFINYSYSVVNYQARQEAIQYWYGTPAKDFSPSHDRRHQINMLGSVDLFGFKLNARWQYGSGLPFTQALGFDEFVLLAGPTDVTQEPGDTRVLYGEPYKARLPDYHRLDISLERSITLSNHADIKLQGSVTNAYDRTNLFYIDLFTLHRLNQLPMIPSLGLKVSFH